MADPRVIFKILAENQQAKKVLDDTAGAFDKVQSAAGKMAVPAGLALGIIGAGALEAIDAASDVEQSFGALESVYKDNADAAKKLAGSAAADVGLASSSYAQLAAVLGSQLKGMGTAADELVPATDQLIDLGADLAATYGGTTADAVAAISSLLRGERDPIEKYGVAIKQVDVNAALAAKGLDKLEGPAKTQAEAMATLELLTGKTADAQGAFAREADTAAHAQQVANAQFEDAKAALGTALLPVVVAVADAFAELSVWVKENTTTVQIIVGVIAGLAAGIIAVNLAMKVWQAATIAFTAVQWLLNAALTANPIGIVVLAIAALIAGIVLLWNNCETFRNIVTAVFTAVKNVIVGAIEVVTGIFDTLLPILKKPFDDFMTGLRVVIDAVKRIWAGITAVLADPIKKAGEIIGRIFQTVRDTVQRVFDFIKGIIDKITGFIDSIKIPKIDVPWASSSSAGGHAVPGLRAARAPAARAAAGPVTVNVYTTGDTMQAEQAVLRALRRQTRINGGVVPAFGWQGR